MEWNVIRMRDGNLEWWNALSVLDIKDIKNKVKKGKDLRELLESEFIHYFRSRSECEILVQGLHDGGVVKIDIYDQLEANMDRIVEYIGGMV